MNEIFTLTNDKPIDQVSQKWKFLIDEVKIQELIIHNHRSLRFLPKFWYRTKKRMNKRNRLAFSKIELCPFDLSNVRRLRIDSRFQPIQCNWNEFLGKFPRLCHLEIALIHENSRNLTLDLPASLKTLRLQICDDIKLHLNSSELKNLFCDFDIRNVTFSHPESIENLKITNVNKNVNGEFQVFPNVKCFHCGEYSYTLGDVDLDLLRIFPKANAFHFDFGTLETAEKFDKMDRVINDIIDRKDILGRSDLNIFCGGTQMRDRRSFYRYTYSW